MLYVYFSVPGTVQYFEAQVRSSNSFSLYWVPPLTEDRNGIIIGYDIAYQTGIHFIKQQQL